MTPALELLAFAGVMALGQFSPGPDMILLTRTALKLGARAGVEMALGIACGLTFHSVIAVAGVALALERSAVLRVALHWLAAAYLAWLAIGIGREIFRKEESQETVVADTSRGPFVRGLLCNLLNPKAAIFLAAVSAPFLKGARPDWWPVTICGIVVVQGCVLWSLWAVLLQWGPLRIAYGKSVKWIDGAFAVVLIGLALRLVWG
ncbi:LysE family translocator [Luteolibacter yonseiensis]|uniref:LysE family translocator n=1 Tax=Luteolibacter yonseiensis TaxID=1144680 RepID=A0A934VDS4_9BACT|nr:LysE family translocator [Luteolibacter yonseiensis]MBK1818435.1 LysE family translocator [Luteolibacter yonseiensis]